MAGPSTTSTNRNVSFIGLRGSSGVWLLSGPPHYEEKKGFPKTGSTMCRAMVFSKDGTLFAYCDGRIVRVVRIANDQVVCELDKPRTSYVDISPCGTVIATWESYAVTKDQPAGTPNLNLWSINTGQHIKGFVQKKQAGWCPQWSVDEGICCRSVNNEVHFFEKNNFENIVNKLHLLKVTDFSLSPRSSPPYHVAVYAPGVKGQPSFVRIYRYPNFGGPGAALANKSFYKADRVDMIWNMKGTALLVLTATEVSADSYYGEQGLHYMAINGDSCIVPRSKNGPIYNVEWNPDSTTFCAVYGLMPAKATIYNLKADAVFDFGTGPRNGVYFNPQGNMLVLAGFGNLAGNLEFWDLKELKLISKPKTPNCTYFEWAPDGIHVVTATTSPRLRVGNGFKVWDYTGTLLYEADMEAGEELWQVTWQSALPGVFPTPRLTYRATPIAGSTPSGPSVAGVGEDSVYVPPHMRGKAKSLQARPKVREDYELPSNLRDQQAQRGSENMSKAAMKNKKRREARQRAKEQGAVQAPPPESQPQQVAAPQETTGDAETNKKIRKLKKKIQAIEKLKEQQEAGIQLDINQMEKLTTEAAIIKELNALTLS